MGNAALKSADALVPRILQPLWKHPTGPKTIFFWAPMAKWSLVLASFGDILDRPVEKLSFKQCATLALTGAIWCRFTMTVEPRVWNLFAVNLFVALTNICQCTRIILYDMSLK